MWSATFDILPVLFDLHNDEQISYGENAINTGILTRDVTREKAPAPSFSATPAPLHPIFGLSARSAHML